MVTKIPEKFLQLFTKGTTDPTGTTRLNLDADLHVTSLTAEVSGTFLGTVTGYIAGSLSAALNCVNKLVYWNIYTISGTTIDVANGNKQKLTLSDSNIVVTLTAPSGACAFHLFIYQGSTARTITWPTILWLGGTAPDLTTTSGKYVICLAWDGTNWFGSWGAYS